MPRSTVLILCLLVSACASFAQNTSKSQPTHTAVTASSSKRYDLAGNWNAVFGNNPPIKLDLEQSADEMSLNVVLQDSAQRDIQVFQGKYVSGSTINGKVLTGVSDSGRPTGYLPAPLVIDDDNHLHIGKLISMSRLPPEGPRKPCDPQHDSHVPAATAYQNADDAAFAYDFKTMNCWAKIGADQGDAASQNTYGNSLLKGRGMQQNIPEAITWFEKSAKQHYYYAEVNLAQIYHFGRGVPVDDQKAEFWRAAAEKDEATRVNGRAERAKVEAGMRAIAQDTINKALTELLRNDCSSHQIRDFSDGIVLDNGTSWHADKSLYKEWSPDDQVTLCIHAYSGILVNNTMTNDTRNGEVIELRTF